MSLVTRCPACDMVFRVVQDQLKVSGGWVRCGHCDEVFNALESLFEADHLPAHAGGAATGPLEQGQTPMLREPVGSASSFDSRMYSDFVASTTLLPSHFGAEAGTARRAPTWDLDRHPPAAVPMPAQMPPYVPVPVVMPPHSVVLPEPESEPAPAPAPQEPAPPAPTPEPLAEESLWPATLELEISEPAPALPPLAPPTSQALAPTSEAATAPSEAPPPPHAPAPSDPGPSTLPQFMRQAEAAASWHGHPVAQWVMSLGCVLLIGLLGLQTLIQQRSELATNYVGLRPFLLKLCKVAGCELESPRAIEQLVLVSSQIQQTSERGVLHLSAELHNSARHPVLTPALDLTLTDAYGQVLVRKVFTPQALHNKTSSLQASDGWQIDHYVRVGSLPVAGFSIELFYP